jgi:hypothetical protein
MHTTAILQAQRMGCVIYKSNHMCNGFSPAVAPSDKVGKKKENLQKIPQTSFE